MENDLHQARELAKDLQRQLAEKSNDVAHLRQTLQCNTLEMRKERNHIALESKRMASMITKLEAAVAERDRVRNEMQVLREALANCTRESETKALRLTAEVLVLRHQLADARGLSRIPVADESSDGGDGNGTGAAEIKQLAAVLKGLIAAQNPRIEANSRQDSSPRKTGVAACETLADEVDISFGS